MMVSLVERLCKGGGSNTLQVADEERTQQLVDPELNDERRRGDGQQQRQPRREQQRRPAHRQGTTVLVRGVEHRALMQTIQLHLPR